jgi:GT2 family glycosyltransferase
MEKIEISFITINYNSSDLTIKLVDSIILQTVGLNFEIIIVDNSSKEEDFKNLYNNLGLVTQVKIVKNKINSGFYSCRKFYYDFRFRVRSNYLFGR